MIQLLFLAVVEASGASGAAPSEERGPSGLQVSGDVSCPTAAQVTQSLALLGADLDARGWRLELSTDAPGSELQMRVQDPSNALVGERRFAGLTDCTQRAEAIAATLAVWLGELAAQALPAPLYPAPIVPPPAAPARSQALATNPADAPVAPTRRWQFELGAAALGSIDDTGAGTAGADLSAWARPVAWRLGWQAHLEWEATRSLPLGPGFADWQRVSLGAGAHFPFQWGWGGFELEADLLAGVIRTQGHDLTVPQADVGLEPGFFVGGRFFIDPRPIGRGWLSAGVAFWPVQQQVGVFSGTASTPAARATLPPLEFLVALGGSWLD